MNISLRAPPQYRNVADGNSIGDFHQQINEHLTCTADCTLLTFLYAIRATWDKQWKRNWRHRGEFLIVARQIRWIFLELKKVIRDVKN